MGRIIHTVRIEHADVRLDWMLGRSIIDVSLGEPLPWWFRFSDSEVITVECLWRLSRSGRLTRTSADHGHQFGLPARVDATQEAAAMLANRAVAEVNLDAVTADLRLKFDGDLLLEIIAEFTSYEAWQVCGPGGICYVAHSGRFSTWTR